MDAKELRAEAALAERSSDGGSKFAPQYDRSKCHDNGASAFKGDTSGSRPCAVIGPDRVMPPARDSPKKAPVEPWLTSDPVYRRLSDYPHKMSDHKDPSRNISPRQTFQENMQRIIMPPGYNTIKLHEDPYASKNKLNVPLEVKYCDVPYNINSISSDQKHIRNADHSASNINPLLMRGPPQGWPAGSVNVRPLRPYGAPEVLQYPEYANCTGPRPVLTRPHTSGHEEQQQLYPEPYYESSVRFKPYPNMKERYPQTRYEYLGNYSNAYHSAHPYGHKYELPKTMPPHTYSGYPPVPVKYTERVHEPLVDGYQRIFSQQGNYSGPIRNPVIHPPYRPVPGNHMQNKLHPYLPDGQHNPPVPNKLSYDPTSKMYLDYDTRTKVLPVADNYYLNELPRSYQAKNTVVLPNYASANMHGVNTHPYYIKDNMSLKNYDYARLKNMDPSVINHSLTKLPPQFSPSTLAISPADSNASNETVQTHGTAQEDCGYASQSSVTSVRSIESLNRMPMDLYSRYDYRYGQIVRASQSSKSNPNSNQGSKSKKDIRQFISSWSEGDDENAENSAKRDCNKIITDDKHAFNKQYEGVNNQEQLYVLGLVNVPSEELSKYEHIQKVSKLPENIKGYNSLELLNQFEEAIESSNISNAKPPTPRAVQMPLNVMSHKRDPLPRAVSPLDVEAKISQSVIHKDVGCNFEIKPCSPKMLNVEVATPMQTLLNERVIEKVANPLTVKSPVVLQSIDENLGSTSMNTSMKYPAPNSAPSCKMINGHHLSESSAIDHLKTNYSLQDLESSSGVCLASLPRLDTDIELNFPEVNQQFINANKTDSVITASLTKDLPTLDIDQSESNNLKNSIPGTDYDMDYQFSPKMENETDFSRLSKYRKLKRSVPNDNGVELAKAQATRVDSVIIKNPDNTRSVEESNDTVISGGYFRADSQEFAMNLVSQAKNAKADQHEIDKMLGTSTSSAGISRYDETGIHSRSNIATHKSGTTLNKSFNVIDETTRNYAVHVHSEDHSMHSKDLLNRYVEKAALDIPMNLSPQAKYSMVGVDEETKNNSSEKLNQQNTISDVKRGFSVEKTCLNKNAQEEQKNTSAVNLDKTNDRFNSNVADKQFLDTDEEPNTKTNISSKCSSTDFIKQCDGVDIYENDHTVLQTDETHASAMKAIYKAQNSGFEINKKYGLNKGKAKDTTKTKEIVPQNHIDDKKELEANVSAPDTDKINHQDRGKEHDIVHVNDRKSDGKILHVSNKKKKKYKAEVTHRKGINEKKKTGCGKHKINRKRHNLKKSLNSERENSVKKSTNEEPIIVSVKQNNTESSIFKEACIGNRQNETLAFNLEAAHDAAANYFNENINDAAESIKTKSSEVIKDNMPLSCIPIEDKCLKALSKLEMEAIPRKCLPIEISNEFTNKYSEKLSHAATPTVNDTKSDGPLTSSKNPIVHASSNILSCDQIEFKENSLVYNNTHVKEKEVGMPVLLLQDEKHTKEKQVSEIVNFETKESYSPELLDKNEKQTNVIEKRQELDPMPSKTDNGYQDIQILNKDNASIVPRELKKDFTQREITKDNFTKKKTKFRAYVSKELFSPRIQNLLIYHENSGTFSSARERRNIDSQFSPQKTKMDPSQPVNQNSEISATRDIGIIRNNIQNFNEVTNDGNTIENVCCESSNNSEINVDQAGMPEGSNENNLDKQLDVTSAEFTNISNDLNYVDNDLNEETDNEITNNNEKTNVISEIPPNSYEILTDSIDENETIADADSLQKPVITASFCDQIVNDCDKKFEKNDSDSELNSGSTNKVETDTDGTNIIVIDETSTTQGHCNEYRKIGSTGSNTYELDKKIQPFGQNLDGRPRFSLKRSLSDSALDAYDDDVDESLEKRCFMLPKKRKKLTDTSNIDESHLLNIIQSSRRNSISTLGSENFSFCILIDDNCIVAEETYEQENDFMQIENELPDNGFKNCTVEDEKSTSLIYNTEDQNENHSGTYTTKCDEDKTWVDDVGCEETIETEDIAENVVIGEPVSPKDTDLSDYESDDDEMSILNNDAVNHTNKVKHIYGDNMCTNDAQLVDALYRTPQMDVNKKLMDRESQITEKGLKYYDSHSLEMLLAEPVTNNIQLVDTESNIDWENYSSAQVSNMNTYTEGEVTTCFEVVSPLASNLNHTMTNITSPNEQNIELIKSSMKSINDEEAQDFTILSCESSLDNVFSYIHKGDRAYTSSSSPEVSSTTSEEKNSSILLKISNFKGSRISEVKDFTYDKQKENSCKLTENVYLNPNYNNGMPTNRPLLTKAAQKYIPPIRETIPDLKVKLALPQQSLQKLQKNKVAKEEPKLSTHNIYSSNINIKVKKEIPKKVKPKFEDVLKNIDEVQFQMHKEKNKKCKKYIPKVVIKKSENGSHYASTSANESFNPDLTGRKWQPWVFIEKNQFIDKMALRNKTRAVFSHRRKSYVLTEKFCKYKSISSAKFIISQPKINNFSTGNLKYTIKLKHTY